MSHTRFEVVSSYKQTLTTGAVTGIAAGSSTAGHILALRNPTGATRTIRLRSLEVEFLLTTAFGAAQEVGFDAYILRGYTALHTGGSAVDLATSGTGKKRASYDAATLTGRIASASAMTAGTHTLETNAIARGGVWCAAIGAQLGPRYYDFLSVDPFGILLGADEGVLVRNTIAMGATGVGKWHFTFEWDEGVLFT